MAITTYAQLQAAVASWLDRSNLTDQIPDFIALAEARLNRSLRLRLAEADSASSTTIDSRTMALPTDYAEAVSCWILATGETDRQELRFIDPALVPTSTISGRPGHWTIDNSALGFERPCDAVYTVTLRYLAKFALSDTVTTNSLLTNYPDAYLFATLCEAGPFLRDPDYAALWNVRTDAAISEINSKEARSRAQSTLVTEAGILANSARRTGFNVYRGH